MKNEELPFGWRTPSSGFATSFHSLHASSLCWMQVQHCFARCAIHYFKLILPIKSLYLSTANILNIIVLNKCNGNNMYKCYYVNVII